MYKNKNYLCDKLKLSDKMTTFFLKIQGGK